MVAHRAVAVVVHHGAHVAVDGELLPVRAETRELRVEVGEVAALEEGVIGEADACFVLATISNSLSFRIEV